MDEQKLLGKLEDRILAGTDMDFLLKVRDMISDEIIKQRELRWKVLEQKVKILIEDKSKMKNNYIATNEEGKVIHASSDMLKSELSKKIIGWIKDNLEIDYCSDEFVEENIGKIIKESD